MKLFKKSSLFVALAFIASLFVPLMANAAMTTAELTVLESASNLSILVEYEIEKPIVEFISPSGTVYSETSTPLAVMTVEDQDKSTVYRIKNAESGTWHIRYDKLTNPGIYVSLAHYYENIWIQSFTVNFIGKSSANVSFETSYNGNAQIFAYKIYASAQGESGEKLLSSGTAISDRQVTLDLPLSSLSSFENYVLRLYVSLDHNGTELFDIAETESFSYVNPDQREGLRDFKLYIDTDNLTITADWQETAVSWSDAYFAAFFADNQTEPFAFYDLESNVYSVSASYDSEYKYVTAKIYAKRNGILSNAKEKTVQQSDSAKIAIDAEETTNSAMVNIRYNELHGESAEVTLNGVSQEFSFSGSGAFSVQLSDGSNSLEITYGIGDGIYFVKKVTIYLDMIPPAIEIFNNIDGAVTIENSVSIAGCTEAGAVLTVSGQNVEVNDDGTFSCDITLEPGENVLQFAATDVSGNSSVLSLVVTKTIGTDGGVGAESSIKGFLPLLVSFGVGLIFIAAALILFSFERKSGGENTFLISAIVFFAASALSFVGDIVLWVMYFLENAKTLAPEFIDIAVESVSRAYKMIEQADRLRSFAFLLLAVAVVLNILGWICLMIHRFVKKRRETLRRLKEQSEQKYDV